MERDRSTHARELLLRISSAWDELTGAFKEADELFRK